MCGLPTQLITRLDSYLAAKSTETPQIPAVFSLPSYGRYCGGRPPPPEKKSGTDARTAARNSHARRRRPSSEPTGDGSGAAERAPSNQPQRGARAELTDPPQDNSLAAAAEIIPYRCHVPSKAEYALMVWGKRWKSFIKFYK